jgi:hypothetical protein
MGRRLLKYSLKIKQANGARNMASNYLLLELDTTAPTLHIYAPSYTTRSTITPITIEANETIGSHQEIYVIDSAGNRKDLTFTHEGSSLVGELSFNDYPIGIATLYVRLKDEVDNVSSLYSHTISIMESEILTSEMKIEIMQNQMGVVTMNQMINVQTMKNEMAVIS